MAFITESCCEICGSPFELETQRGKMLCGVCLAEQPPFSRARAVCVYNEVSRRIVTGLKFKDRTYLAPVMGEWMARSGKVLLTEAEVIIPVPLHRYRLLRRHYNQSMLLARTLSDRSGVAVLPLALQRKRHTLPQTGLNRRERQKNVSGAFKVNPKYIAELRQKHVILVDDVLTTGATINACTKALLKAGAVRVDVLTFSRTKHD